MDLISVEPDKELEFKRPFNTVVKQSLAIKNNSFDAPVAFKVKTTAPKQYCVRPNSGRIPPGGQAEVQVLLQAMREDPPADYKCKDKFLIQCIRIGNELLNMDGDAANLQLSEVWTQAEQLKRDGSQTESDLMTEKKIRCAFLPANGQMDLSEASGSLSKQDSFSVNQAAARPTTPSASGEKEDLESLKSLLKAHDRELAESKQKVASLSSAFDQYKSETERLNQGLRQRKPESSSAVSPSTKTGTPAWRVTPSPLLGFKTVMPIEWVVILVVIAFLSGMVWF